jgi:pimeloyl-ACP methyl ester carboxylesterase
MTKTNVGGFNLHYEDTGAGQPLVLIPGLSCDHTVFAQTQVPAFAAAGYRCVSIDNRDVGQSDSSPVDQYSLRDMAADVAAIIRGLGLGPAHVLGWSMGGMIAQELALNHADCVSTLTLYAADAGRNPRLKAWLESMILIRSRTTLTEFMTCVCPWMFNPRFFGIVGAVEGVIAMAAANPYPQPPDAFARQSRAIINHDAVERLVTIRVPTHVIAGEDDIVILPDQSRVLAQGIPGARFTVLRGVGHCAVWEDTASFNQAVIDFLGVVAATT